jgi:acetolactate synthase I/II/III large subunit
MNAAELLVRCLESEGTRYIFGLPGEENLEFLHALTSSSISFALAHDERAAAFMANAYGRLSLHPGVCLSTLGPGATNLVTGIADALLDFSPLVAITGQTALAKMHKESHQRIDIVSLLRPVTKWNARIEEPGTIPEVVRKAYKIACFEKPGPVHMELPEDISSAHVSASPIPVTSPQYPEPSEKALRQAAGMIERARLPLILAGNGVLRGRAGGCLKEFVTRSGIGVAATFMGTGAIPADHDLFISTIGLQSRDYISCGLDKADLVIAVGYDPVEYSPDHWNVSGKTPVIHIDFSPSESDSHYPALELLGDIATTLDLLGGKIVHQKDDSFYRKMKSSADNLIQLPESGFPLPPIRVIRDMRKSLGREDILISDVGAHKIWIARFFPAYAENAVVISNGFASMGFAIPAAIAAKLLYPEKKVLAAVGDGGFLMSMAEINTALRMGLQFVCLIFNDGGYGLIQWKEKIRYGKEFYTGFRNPDFVKLAESFGAAGYRVSSDEELLPVLQDAFSRDKVAVIDCPVDYSHNVKLSEKLGRLICPV